MQTVMAEAVGESAAAKILLPSQRCGIRLAVGPVQPMQFYLDEAVRLLGQELGRLGRIPHNDDGRT